MSENRSFGDIISGNRQKNHEFSPEAKAAMLAMLEAGLSQRAVARQFKTSHGAVAKVLKRFRETGTVKNKPRSGRASVLNRAQKRYILRMIRRDRSISWDALVSEFDGKVSQSTIRRVVKCHYKRKWKAMERPKLDANKARERLRFARFWLPRIDELEEMINSDESSINNKSSNPNVYLFRGAHEKYNQELVNKGDHVKPPISMMFWGGIWKTGRTPIILMKRDPLAPRNGYSSWSYEIALRDGLLPINDGTRRFQQDNASIHRSGEITTWFERNGIILLNWPPCSPDMSPIENVWNILKRRLRRIFPYLRDMKDNYADRAEFQRCVEIAWNSIPQSMIRELLESTERRLQAVIRARGWYTKY